MSGKSGAAHVARFCPLLCFAFFAPSYRLLSYKNSINLPRQPVLIKLSKVSHQH